MGSSLNSGQWSRLEIFMKFSSVAVMLLLVIAALGPGKWQPRTGLGWQAEHFVGYFGVTTIFFATAMDLAMMAPAQRHGELIAYLPA
jgi:hypothetical protein